MWWQIGYRVQSKGSASAVSPLLDYRLPTFGCILTWQNEGWRASGVSLIRALIWFMRAPSSRHNNHHLKTLPPSTITLGLEFRHMDFGGHKCSVYCTGFDFPSPALAPTYPVSLVLQPSHHFCGLTSFWAWFLLFSTSNPVGSIPNKRKTLTKWD